MYATPPAYEILSGIININQCLIIKRTSPHLIITAWQQLNHIIPVILILHLQITQADFPSSATTVSINARVPAVMWSQLKSSIENGLLAILCIVLVELATVATL